MPQPDPDKPNSRREGKIVSRGPLRQVLIRLTPFEATRPEGAPFFFFLDLEHRRVIAAGAANATVAEDLVEGRVVIKGGGENDEEEP